MRFVVICSYVVNVIDKKCNINFFPGRLVLFSHCRIHSRDIEVSSIRDL